MMAMLALQFVQQPALLKKSNVGEEWMPMAVRCQILVNQSLVVLMVHNVEVNALQSVVMIKSNVKEVMITMAVQCMKHALVRKVND